VEICFLARSVEKRVSPYSYSPISITTTAAALLQAKQYNIPSTELSEPPRLICGAGPFADLKLV